LARRDKRVDKESFMKLNNLVGCVLAIGIGMSAFSADQIEKEANEKLGPAPKAVLVRVSPSDYTIEVFQAPDLNASVLSNTASERDIEAAINEIAKPSNKIVDATISSNELENESSTAACWHRRWYCGGWRWNYPIYRYNWHRPYAYPGYFNYGGYNPPGPAGGPGFGYSNGGYNPPGPVGGPGVGGGYNNGGYGGYNPPGPAGGPGAGISNGGYNPPGPVGGPGVGGGYNNGGYGGYNPPGPAGGPGAGISNGGYNPPGPAGGPGVGGGYNNGGYGGYNPPGPAGGPGAGVNYNYRWNYNYKGSNYGFYY
jgi:hypothetical protein